MSLGANIKYRWNLLLQQTASGGIHQLSFGPGLGIRHLNACLFQCKTGWMASAMASLEYVYWVSRNFGLTAQLDAGVDFLAAWNSEDTSQRPGYILPMSRLSIGLAF